MAISRGTRKKVRRTVSPHRKTTVKYGRTYSKRADGRLVRRLATGPKKVRKAPQVHRPWDDVRNRGSPFMHGASYGVSQGKTGRLSQQKFRHLTVKVAKILGYPQSAAGKKMTQTHKLQGRDTMGGRRHPQRLTDYEKLALALAEEKGLFK